jgi:hypothetical protein
VPLGDPPRPPFRDLFSRGAATYAAHRPRYPAVLFAELARRAPRRDVAWDCATGNGQAALGLAAHFRRVVATDGSAAQIAAAVPHRRVSYHVALAEASGLQAGSVDLVTVAQALHWLDIEAFFAEAQRVVVVQGVVAAWCYGLLEIDARIDRVIRRFCYETLADYWPPERRLVDTGYRTIDFPFAEFVMPSLTIERELSLDQLAGFLRSWSATQRYVEDRGEDPVSAVMRDVERYWPSSATRRPARWPLSIRAGYRDDRRE